MEQLELFEKLKITKKYQKKEKHYKNYDDFLNNADFNHKNFDRIKTFLYLVPLLDSRYYLDISIRQIARALGFSRCKIIYHLNFWKSLEALDKKDNKYCLVL